MQNKSCIHELSVFTTSVAADRSPPLDFKMPERNGTTSRRKPVPVERYTAVSATVYNRVRTHCSPFLEARRAARATHAMRPRHIGLHAPNHLSMSKKECLDTNLLICVALSRKSQAVDASALNSITVLLTAPVTLCAAAPSTLHTATVQALKGEQARLSPLPSGSSGRGHSSVSDPESSAAETDATGEFDAHAVLPYVSKAASSRGSSGKSHPRIDEPAVADKPLPGGAAMPESIASSTAHCGLVPVEMLDRTMSYWKCEVCLTDGFTYVEAAECEERHAAEKRSSATPDGAAQSASRLSAASTATARSPAAAAAADHPPSRPRRTAAVVAALAFKDASPVDRVLTTAHDDDNDDDDANVDVHNDNDNDNDDNDVAEKNGDADDDDDDDNDDDAAMREVGGKKTVKSKGRAAKAQAQDDDRNSPTSTAAGAAATATADNDDNSNDDGDNEDAFSELDSAPPAARRPANKLAAHPEPARVLPSPPVSVKSTPPPNAQSEDSAAKLLGIVEVRA